MNNQKFKILTNESDIGKRLDLVLTERLQISRSKSQNLIKKGYIIFDEKIINKPSSIIAINKILIKGEIPQPENNYLIKENILLNILYENDQVLVINKDPNIVVHPALSLKSGTLLNAVMGYLNNHQNSFDNQNSLRPGVVHRLDKETSGVIIFAKNEKTHLYLAEQFAQRKVIKEYCAIVHGTLKYSSATIDSPISRSPSDRQKMSIAINSDKGKYAITEYVVDKCFQGVSLINVNIKTGRTHQIRVHLSSIGHPLLGDKKYNSAHLDKLLEKKRHFKIPRILLHAKTLTIRLSDSAEKMTFNAPLPDDFQNVLNQLVK